MCKKNVFELPNLVPKGYDFTIHHIMSRSKGGGRDMDNLIGLCSKCHDIIEPKDLNRREIENYYGNASSNKKDKKYTPIKDWHMWVYGGYRKPV